MRHRKRPRARQQREFEALAREVERIRWVAVNRRPRDAPADLQGGDPETMCAPFCAQITN